MITELSVAILAIAALVVASLRTSPSGSPPIR